MTWFHWLLVALFAAEPLAKIALIDVPRQPLSRFDAIVAVVVNALLIWGLISFTS